MIVRIWHGRTARARADEYAEFLKTWVIEELRDIPGNINATVLRRDEEDVTHFLTLSSWESEEAIRGYSGDDILKVKYYPNDRDFLLELEPQVQLYTTVAHAP
jgi:heme-degrading monooxygenase HmoA